MGKFINFLKESPLFMYDGRIECPYKDHKGGPINGGDNFFRFDSLSELFGKDSEYQKRMFHAYKPNNPTGKVPLLCRKDMKVFMWNVDEDTTYAARRVDDIDFCNKFIEVMKSDRSKDRNSELLGPRFDFDAISLLTPDESKR